MKLYQKKWASQPILNNTYYDDSGQTVYKVSTPLKLSDRTTTITKFLSSTATTSTTDGTVNVDLSSSNPTPGRSSTDHDVDDNSEEGSDGDGEKESSSGPETQAQVGLVPFIYLAQIDWKLTESSKLRFGDGKEVEAAKFFRKDKDKRREQVFTASDGVEYKWVLGLKVPELFKNGSGSSQEPVARFYRRKQGLFNKSTPGYLEILPAGQHIADEIFITFIYIEKIRKDTERSRSTTETGSSESAKKKRVVQVNTDLEGISDRIQKFYEQDEQLKKGSERPNSSRLEGGKKVVTVNTDLDENIYQDPRLLLS